MKQAFLRRIKHDHPYYIGVGTVLFLAVYCLSGFAAADQLTERSIQLSSAAPAAKNVTYTVTFMPAKTAAAFVVDFCSNSPLAGQTCQAPAGLSTAAVHADTVGFNDVTALNNHSFVVAGTLTANLAATVAVQAMVNPSAAGTIYARIITYDSKAHALAYQSTSLHEGVIDTGSVAIAITPSIGFQATVPESMLFCLSGETISQDCGDLTTPAITLGADTAEGQALSTDTVSTGVIYTQLSTNAIGGAVIRLTSDAENCGGLVRADDPTACDIAPAQRDGVTAGTARFGVKTAAATGTGLNASGTLQPFTGSGYNTDSFTLNYATDGRQGVTSQYGDPMLDTAGAPVNNQNMALTFGASINSTTPAGDYTVKMGLIATGRF